MPYPQVEYFEHKIAEQSLVVDVLSPERAQELAGPVLRLIVEGYAHQYEGPDKPLESGAFARKYDNEAARRRWHDEVVPGVYERGGGYYTVTDPHEPEKLAAVFKALPGPAIGDGFTDFAAGIAEVVVAPAWQGNQLAVATILTYLEHGDLRPNDRVMADVVSGSPIAGWLWSLFFDRKAPSGELRLDHRNALPTYYYESGRYSRSVSSLEELVTVGSLTAVIKDRYPTLRNVAVSP